MSVAHSQEAGCQSLLARPRSVETGRKSRGTAVVSIGVSSRIRLRLRLRKAYDQACLKEMGGGVGVVDLAALSKQAIGESYRQAGKGASSPERALSLTTFNVRTGVVSCRLTKNVRRRDCPPRE